MPRTRKRPKFPEAPNLVFLADYARRDKSETATKMLHGTLEKISQGGIRDHVGGGFHRYSTDRYWRVPHFEKMLYDNGQLASVYQPGLRTGAARRLPPRRRRSWPRSWLREMTDEGGAFYSAIDAETNAHEGRYYVWDRAEVAGRAFAR